MTPTKRIVVIGGGFAGLWAVRQLARAPVEVVLIDRCNHHLFQPLLYQVATAGLAAPSIAAPLRHILSDQKNVTVLMHEVRGIDTAAREVDVGERKLGYDYLLVASGATHAYFGKDQWAAHAPGLKTLDDAFLIRRRILSAFERAEAATSDGNPARARRRLSVSGSESAASGVDAGSGSGTPWREAYSRTCAMRACAYCT